MRQQETKYLANNRRVVIMESEPSDFWHERTSRRQTAIVRSGTREFVVSQRRQTRDEAVAELAALPYLTITDETCRSDATHYIVDIGGTGRSVSRVLAIRRLDA